MLGKTLVTIQTGPAGRTVKRLFIEDGCDIAPRALPLRAGRPRHLAHLLHRLHRRRHGHREGGARHARQDRHAVDRSGLRLRALPRPQDRRRAEARRRPDRPVRQADRPALSRLRREGHEPARDQPAGGDQGRQARCASTPRSTSRTTRCSGTRTWPSCATSTRRTRPRSRPPSTTSTTSSSTARSAAWSTAPASPWPPWTSSSSTAWSPPTSSTSAAAPPRRRWRRPSRSSCPTPT